MMRVVPLLAFVVISACDILFREPVLTPDMTAKERFVEVVEVRGCEMNPRNADRIMAEANIDVSEVGVILAELAAEGKLEATGPATVRLITSWCR